MGPVDTQGDLMLKEHNYLTKFLLSYFLISLRTEKYFHDFREISIKDALDSRSLE